MPEKTEVPILVKTFVQKVDQFPAFDKNILIARDPRDQFLSVLMYKPYGIILRNSFNSEEKTQNFLNNFLELLRSKQKDPHSVSIKEIENLYESFKPGINYGTPLIDYYLRNSDLFILKYEDFVDGNLEELNKYLGLKIKVAQNVPEKRVIRTKAYNNWKNWFTPSDVDLYKDVFKKYMEVFGYEEDWELNENPVIDPKEGTLYIEKIISDANDKRAKQELT
jgi:hypothetical protein